MKTYTHHLERVEDYLHHRPPYLMVDRLISITPEEIVTETVLQPDAYFLAGHFPGAPILPGAMMQEMTTQTAGMLIAAHYNPMPEFNTQDPFFNEYALGVLVKVKNARFRNFARPGDRLETRVMLKERIDMMFEFRGQVSLAGRPIMQNGFQLTNIPSKLLQGRSDAVEAT